MPHKNNDYSERLTKSKVDRQNGSNYTTKEYFKEYKNQYFDRQAWLGKCFQMIWRLLIILFILEFDATKFKKFLSPMVSNVHSMPWRPLRLHVSFSGFLYIRIFRIINLKNTKFSNIVKPCIIYIFEKLKKFIFTFLISMYLLFI